MRSLSNLIGAVMLVGGALKLTRQPAYEDFVEGLDWSDEQRQVIGGAEMFGGALMLTPAGRRLGAGLVLAASGAALLFELRAERQDLALARGGVMLAALAVLAGD